MNTQPCASQFIDIVLGGERLFPLSLSTYLGESDYLDGTCLLKNDSSTNTTAHLGYVAQLAASARTSYLATPSSGIPMLMG
jgi:hypothetical protein